MNTGKEYLLTINPIQAILSDAIFDPMSNEEKVVNFSSPTMSLMNRYPRTPYYTADNAADFEKTLSLIHINFELDYHQQIYTRQVVTLLDTFGNIGGFEGFVTGIVAMIINKFEDKLFQFKFFKFTRKEKVLAKIPLK